MDRAITSEPGWDWHCADHAAAAVESATGRDVWAELGVKPRAARDGAEIFRRLGVTNLKDALTAILGPPLDPAWAMRGDVAMVDNALGICRGEWIECLDRMQPIARAECVWPLS